jgi:hypothetical protein
MVDIDVEGLFEHFRLQKDTYLRVIEERSRLTEELNKTVERLKLLKRLLEVDGREVTLPNENDLKNSAKSRVA